MSDNIKVVVKVRPLIPREIEDKLYYQWRVTNNTLYQIDQNGKDCNQYFTFDKVYDKDAKTSEVYNDIAKPIVEAAAAGFNGTIFAYGQTSSGKTYTMTGTDESPGIIPLAVLNLFEIIKRIPDREFLVRVSYVEIYNETLTDLLDQEKKVKIQETFHGVKVDTTEKVTTTPEEVLDVMRQGKVNRQTASTNMNDESSRSHSIFQITIESRDHIKGEEEVGSVNISQLNLVDLAGSERAGQTGATGLRFKEGTHINKSLSALALVIKQLSEGQNKHVNYRDSKLTRILQNSLGGNAKTSIICAVTPAAVEETISTLQFANRAKAIKNRPEVNAVATSASMIQSLTKQISVLKTDLENKKNVEYDNCKLQKKIGLLERLILNGFHQSSGNDMISNARRKLNQPRRMTISTLHSIQEDSVATSIPKFCTPSLKYNPLTISGNFESVSIAGASSLPCLSEGPSSQLLARSKEKSVCFSDEIIELDSDDDDTPTDLQTSSPYHKCYDSSRTPPCVLRKNCQEAEKNYRNLVKLTETAKIYPPDVIELMNKLEGKSLSLLELEEELKVVNDLCKEKDDQIANLINKVSSIENELKNMMAVQTDLTALCEEYKTKLTDWEVSYETLLKKSKNREKELLSLLEEQSCVNQNMYVHIDAPQSPNTKHTYLIDTTSHTTFDNDVATKKIRDLMTELEEKVFLKDQTIKELNANISAHKYKIGTLENVNAEIREMLTNYKQNVVLLENENTLQASKISDLNFIVKNQKAEILSLNTDINSYNTVVHNIQVKLLNPALNNISDDCNLDTMIANEELFMANNENMKNIIQSLKEVLNKKNLELKKLKTSLQTETNIDSTNDETKLNILSEEIKTLKEELSAKVKIIQDLNHEKNRLASIETELTLKLANIEDIKNNLENINCSNLIEIENLKKENFNLSSQKLKLIEEYKSREDLLKTENGNMISKIGILDDIIKTKDLLIATLTEKHSRTEENLKTAKLALCKLQEIIERLSGNIQEIPESLDNSEVILKLYNEMLNTLDSIIEYNIEDKKTLQSLVNKYETEIIKLKHELDNINIIIDTVTEEFIENIKSNQISIDKNNNLQTKIKTLIDIVKSMQTDLLLSIDCKNEEINKVLSDKTAKESELDRKSLELESKTQELEKVSVHKDTLLQKIFIEINKVISLFNIDHDIYFANETSSDYSEYILKTIDHVANLIRIITSENQNKCSDINIKLSKAKTEINLLTEENLKLNNDIKQFEIEKSCLYKDIDCIRNTKEKVISDLSASNMLLNELQDDLKSKSSEIEIFQNRALEWKEKFLNVDASVKQQLLQLEFENANLRYELERYSSKQSLVVDVEDRNYHHDLLKENSDEVLGLKSPPSLLTICCNRIIDSIETNESDNSVSPSSSNTVFCNSDTQSSCKCSELLCEVTVLQNDNNRLKKVIEKLQNRNSDLINEQDDAKKEIQLLLESMSELQRKIVNHRTNLSTLTATTYAENKSLSSQLKFLQHYHSLFYKACEKDIPDFKKQLQELMAILITEYSQKANDTIRPSTSENSDIHMCHKNESVLDGDLLMLDTNVTLTTCNNTLTGHDQTGFDVTLSTSEVGCQTHNCSEVTEIHNPVEDHETNFKILQSLESLKTENYKLREIVDEYELIKQNKQHCVDSQNSPMKISEYKNNHQPCDKCLQLQEILQDRDSILNEKVTLIHKLSELTSLKNDIEIKYNNLLHETPSTDSLVVKLKNLEKDLHFKSNEISKLQASLKEKNEEFKVLQDENDTLSNQLMENIDEADSLRNEVISLKQYNSEISQRCSQLQSTVDTLKEENTNIQNCAENCKECTLKDAIINSLQSKLVPETHKRLSRSYSEFDNSSRYNKICTLQNELHAGREDCNELKNEVTNIKNHLDRNNLSTSQAMDLDESMGDSHSVSYNKDVTLFGKSDVTDIPKEQSPDLYALDKIDCINYCIEKTTADKEKFTCDMRIVDLLKILYTNLVTKHNNEIENLLNNMRDYEESKNLLQTKLNNLMKKQEDFLKDIEEKEMYLQTMAKVVSQLKDNLKSLNNITNECEVSDIVVYFKENFLRIVDKEFGLASLREFECILKLLDIQHSSEIAKLSESNNTHQNQLQKISDEYKSIRSKFETLKSQLLAKENEYNLLIKQRERMYEINNAVTLDIVLKENILKETVNTVYQELHKQKLIEKEYSDIMSLPINETIPILFNCMLEKQKHSLGGEEKNALLLELSNMKALLEEKHNELHTLKVELRNLNDLNRNVNEQLSGKDKELLNQISLHDTLKNMYDKKVEENETNLNIISKLTEEINLLKLNLDRKEDALKTFGSQLHIEKQKNQTNSENNLLHLKATLEQYKEDMEKLKSAHSVILKEKESAYIELEQANNLIQQNKLDIEKLTADMLVLKDTINQSSKDMDNLRTESKKLLEQNTLLTEEVKEKTNELSQLQANIKTHLKTAETQCKIMARLKKAKADADKSNSEYIEKVAELTRMLDEVNEKNKLHYDEINSLKNIKQTLEDRISELEIEAQNKLKHSFEVHGDSRSRRQSLYDSLRIFSDNESDPKKVDAVFKLRKVDDLFMDVDYGSNRSTPIRLSKGRDSFASRHDQSEEEGSRASSVQATRRRRQSIHDAHRTVSAVDTIHRHSSDRDNDSSNSDSEVSRLRKQLSVCQEELEEWREKYREVDEECETCAEYLREREEQCCRLKIDKENLESMIEELQQKLHGANCTNNPSVNVAVNTEEDWANLHSVVVDRMSYDAEVDKNKKLTRTIEQLRYKKHELENSVNKLQTALEKASCKDRELETVKSELLNCHKELVALRERNHELDEECETCAEYLKEREEQCCLLKMDKENLEIMIEKLNQKLRDVNLSKNSLVDVAVNTEEDWPNLQSVLVENKKLTTTLEQLGHKKHELENSVSKLQKALENTSCKNRELETIKLELSNCQKELVELRERNRELDEECETCAEYLKEREEQCRKLKEAKKALEIKLLDYQDVSVGMSVRKKRQSLHDRNRLSDTEYVDVATDTGEDFLPQDDVTKKLEETSAEELIRLKTIVERLSQQKVALEQQLVMMSAVSPVYVSTGSSIVQNQQFTDVLKENQKLKNINAKLMKIYKKNKSQNTNRENEKPTDEINN